MYSPLSQESLSLPEFLALPETQPDREYINGKIHPKPMPQGKHSRLQTKLAALINQQGESPHIAVAFCELRCQFGGRVLVPDISIFKWANIPKDEENEPLNTIQIPPDWLIEILFPNQSAILLIDQINFALRHGTELAWLISSQEKSILTFRGNEFAYHQGAENLPVLAELHPWHVSASDIWQLLKLT
ncbi:Uncharacterized protein conserved in cyanobacteria [Gloeomargarita lithophora Alchichica-D10]|uniref:Uncharacterized protein conserved in cyanobacteria n=1 Tax=Gloeomargarita lithophora Alchichica-D10 TaxID=1188229 RepID=A0A1J0AE93_9CYAN|nr:Uma2 family endonuclease [Gloeomargarita lithophora]APB34253.1 Uncharacterized protein conserved in cyanobacteria [Gloeomargarita lithophora Alchichica-D10]